MRFYIDINGTLDRLQDSWCARIREELHESIWPVDITSYDRLAGSRYQQLLCLPGMFLNAAVEDGAKQGVATLVRAGHEVFVLSALDVGVSEKEMWIHRHFPFLPHDRIIFSLDKPSEATPDRVLIDDSPENVIRWRAKGGTGVIFTQPWNSSVPAPRLDGWSSLPELLAPFA